MRSILFGRHVKTNDFSIQTAVRADIHSDVDVLDIDNEFRADVNKYAAQRSIQAKTETYTGDENAAISNKTH
jgi:hypothetical protein